MLVLVALCPVSLSFSIIFARDGGADCFLCPISSRVKYAGGMPISSLHFSRNTMQDLSTVKFFSSDIMDSTKSLSSRLSIQSGPASFAFELQMSHVCSTSCTAFLFPQVSQCKMYPMQSLVFVLTSI